MSAVVLVGAGCDDEIVRVVRDLAGRRQVLVINTQSFATTAIRINSASQGTSLTSLPSQDAYLTCIVDRIVASHPVDDVLFGEQRGHPLLPPVSWFDGHEVQDLVPPPASLPRAAHRTRHHHANAGDRRSRQHRARVALRSIA